MLLEIEMHLQVELLPDERLRFTDVVLVVDVIRATTTATALFGSGLETLVLAESRETALDLQQKGELLIGEVGGLRPEGFDFGNSPLEVRSGTFSGRTAVLTTSNGTRTAHLAARSSNKVLLACLNNATAACRLAAELADKEIAILCAGNAGQASLDDIYTAGALAAQLIRLGLTPKGDGVESALKLYHANPDPLSLLTCADRYLEHIGLGDDLGDDIAACAQVDVSGKVGMMSSRRRTGLVFTAP